MSAWGSAFGVAWGDSWGAGAAPVVVPDTHDGYKKRRKERSYRDEQEKRLADIRQAVEAVTAPIAQEIRQAYPSEAQPVDYEALSQDAARVERLLAAYQAQLEEDELALILHLI